jgi:hypothetical protein
VGNREDINKAKRKEEGGGKGGMKKERIEKEEQCKVKPENKEQENQMLKLRKNQTP